MIKIFTDVADMIFDKKSFKFGAFTLKLHEEFPDALLSPFFINMRSKDNPTKKGPLVNADYDLIAQALLFSMNNLSFQAIAGIPRAADPIIEAIERAMPEPRKFRIIKLFKEETKDWRRIIPLPGYDLIPSFTVTDLFDRYKNTGRISQEKYQECIDYVKNN
ncbi:MAG: hypothetical protein U9Q85_03545 [Patescibacteria group bacterium]|nr:hypothetical protein [Patescibacteria group bacterium]